ncbi:MAG: hypothetical protein HQK72_16340 [Desulfamplus sp.]|nr:hypothetical protein [Desulfamplus sp.]
MFNVLPLNFHRMKYYGFLSSNNKKLFKKIKEALLLDSFGKDETKSKQVSLEMDCS